MAHLTSFKSGGSCGVLKHNERTVKDTVKERKNECINSQLTHLNYNLAPPRKEKNLMQEIKNRCETNNVFLSNRKDLNVMSSWVVTLPKKINQEHQQLFFQKTYDFLEAKYGKDNVLSAYVHLDETTPHLHFAFIPVAFDNKNKRKTVSSKRLITRSHLQTFHKELSQSLKKTFGFNVGIENQATKNGNKSVQELKINTLEQETDILKQKKDILEQEITKFEGNLLDQKQISSLNARKSVFKSIKGVSYTDYQNLLKTAHEGVQAKREVSQLKETKKTLEKIINTLENENKELKTSFLQAEEKFKQENECYVHINIGIDKRIFNELKENNFIFNSKIKPETHEILVQSTKLEVEKIDDFIKNHSKYEIIMFENLTMSQKIEFAKDRADNLNSKSLNLEFNLSKNKGLSL